MMHKRPAIAAGAFGFVVAGSLTFAIILLVSPATLWYLPLGRAFFVGQAPPELGMDFYGRCLMSLAGGGLGGLAAYGLAKAIPREPYGAYLGMLLGSFGLLSLWIAAGIMAGALVGEIMSP